MANITLVKSPFAQYHQYNILVLGGACNLSLNNLCPSIFTDMCTLPLGDYKVEIKLLGTGAAEGWPGLFCDCAVCTHARTAGGKNIRSRASALIDGVLKIDLPPDLHMQATRYGLNLRDLRYLLITHSHDDHLCPTELQYMGQWFVTQALPNTLQIYGPTPALNRIQREVDISKIPVCVTPVSPQQVLNLDDYRITAIEAAHDPSQLCLNYIISAKDGTQVLYASDTGWYTDETWQFLERQRFDAVITECTKGPTPTDYSGHLDMFQVIEMKARLLRTQSIGQDTPFIATHFSHLGKSTHEELEYALLSHNIVTAYDGYELSVSATNRVVLAP